MGMAASQARFLQLTARRTNIEYQGQQINQQRLALANASAGLFEKMLSLDVPTPPSSQDDKYYKQGYLFTDTRDGLQKQVIWDTVETPADSLALDHAIDAVSGASGRIAVTSATGGALVTISTAALAGSTSATPAQQTAAITALYDAIHGTGEQAKLGEGYTQVVRNVTIKHNIYTPDGQFSTVEEKAPAFLEFDNLNRLINMTLLESGKTQFDVAGQTTTNTPNQVGQGDKLTYGGTFDDKAYADDMNQYEFTKAAYDFQVERINQETKQIQLQDKSLELKMKQLDTEHNAVQTEMDAVQKVIQKNIESSFKTFA